MSKIRISYPGFYFECSTLDLEHAQAIMWALEMAKRYALRLSEADFQI